MTEKQEPCQAGEDQRSDPELGEGICKRCEKIFWDYIESPQGYCSGCRPDLWPNPKPQIIYIGPPGVYEPLEEMPVIIPNNSHASAKIEAVLKRSDMTDSEKLEAI